jgi:hypothetical protein
MLYIDLDLYKKQKFTGIIEVENNDSFFNFKEGKLHCESGPAIKRISGDKFIYEWYLEGILLFSTNMRNHSKILDFTDKVVLNKSPHSRYPLVQVYKVLFKDNIENRYVIPGMESYIIE